MGKWQMTAKRPAIQQNRSEPHRRSDGRSRMRQIGKLSRISNLIASVLMCVPQVAWAQIYDCGAPSQGKELIMHMSGGTITAVFNLNHPQKKRDNIAAKILAGLIREYGDGVARLATLDPDATPVIVRKGTIDVGATKWIFIVTRTPNERATANLPQSIRLPIETRCFSMDYGRETPVSARCSTNHIDLLEVGGVNMEISWTDDRGIEKTAETALATVQDLKNRFVELYEQHKQRCRQK
jgi:hypothetical protein